MSLGCLCGSNSVLNASILKQDKTWQITALISRDPTWFESFEIGRFTVYWKQMKSNSQADFCYKNYYWEDRLKDEFRCSFLWWIQSTVESWFDLLWFDLADGQSECTGANEDNVWEKSKAKTLSESFKWYCLKKSVAQFGMNCPRHWWCKTVPLRRLKGSPKPSSLRLYWRQL